MSKYKYETWKNILTKLEVGREYSVDNTRPDYEEFVDALKSFSHNWWNFVVRDRETSITFVLLDPIRSLDEVIQSMELWESPRTQAEVKQEKTHDTICDRAYDPEEIKRREKFWGDMRQRGGQNEGPESPLADSNPAIDTLGHLQKDNAAGGLKTSKNENKKINENTEW